MTNGDKIRQMSNEELADYIDTKLEYTNCGVCVYATGDMCRNKCYEGIKAYLDMEVTE